MLMISHLDCVLLIRCMAESKECGKYSLRKHNHGLGHHQNISSAVPATEVANLSDLRQFHVVHQLNDCI